jgi:hypothetical protein
MLLTMANLDSSECFKLDDGTELQINCEKSNFIDIDYKFYGVSEHLHKIGDTGF